MNTHSTQPKPAYYQDKLRGMINGKVVIRTYESWADYISTTQRKNIAPHKIQHRIEQGWDEIEATTRKFGESHNDYLERIKTNGGTDTPKIEEEDNKLEEQQAVINNWLYSAGATL